MSLIYMIFVPACANSGSTICHGNFIHGMESCNYLVVI